MMKKRNNKKLSHQLSYMYDHEADVLYLSQGKPSARDRVVETGDDMLLRVSPRDGSIRGLTILNVSKRANRQPVPVKLPVQAHWMPLAHSDHAYL